MQLSSTSEADLRTHPLDSGGPSGVARDEALRYVASPLQDVRPEAVHLSRNTHLIDRFAMLNARADSLSRKDTVMPIDLIFDEIEKVGP